ncbi:MAG: NUDIX domain-containing protein [Patescibacteria group bacterium]
MADELLDICDEDNNILNIKKMKSEAHKYGLWHRVSHIWIYNSKGEILIQLRAKDKSIHPNVWDVSVGGHVSAGADPITSGLREATEEIGLSLKKENLDLWNVKKIKEIYNEIVNNEFFYIYFYKFDGDLNQLNIQKEEVQEILFVSVNKLEKELDKNPDKYIPRRDYWFEVLDQVKKRLSF